MSKNEHSDFNKFFQSKLENAGRAENGWNVPPQFVFDNAMDTLAEKQKKKSRKALWFLLGALFVLSSVAGLYFIQNYVNDIESKVEEMQLVIDDLQTKNGKNLTSNQNKEKAVSQLSEEIKNQQEEVKTKSIVSNIGVAHKSNLMKKEVAKEQYSTSKKTSNVNQKTKEKTGISSITETKDQKTKYFTPVVVEMKPFKNDQSQQFSNKINQVSSFKRNEVFALQDLNFKFSNFVLESRTYPLSNEVVIIERLPAEIATVGRWSLFVKANENTTCLSMINVDEMSDASLVDYDQRYSGRGFRIGLRYDIAKRLFASVHSSYNRYNNESIFRHNFNYDTANESDLGNGMSNYNSDIFIETPLGSYSTVSQFNVASNYFTDNHAIANRTSIHQNLHVYNLGLKMGLDYPLNSKWNVITALGLSGNYISRVQNHFETTVSMEDKEYDNLVTSPSNMSKAKSVFYSWEAQMAFEYSINENFSLSFGVEKSSALSSLRRATAADQPKTFIHNTAFTLGSRIKF